MSVGGRYPNRSKSKIWSALPPSRAWSVWPQRFVSKRGVKPDSCRLRRRRQSDSGDGCRCPYHQQRCNQRIATIFRRMDGISLGTAMLNVLICTPGFPPEVASVHASESHNTSLCLLSIILNCNQPRRRSTVALALPVISAKKALLDGSRRENVAATLFNGHVLPAPEQDHESAGPLRDSSGCRRRRSMSSARTSDHITVIAGA
jgi:hypothetical protein